MTEIFQVAHWATSLCILVAQHLFLVVPGVRATTLSSRMSGRISYNSRKSGNPAGYLEEAALEKRVADN